MIRSIYRTRRPGGFLTQSLEPWASLSRRSLVTVLVVMAVLLSWTSAARAQQRPSGQPQQPQRDLTDLTLEELLAMDLLSVNVLGTHTHLAGEWMIGYKFMFMRMDGNRDGTDQLTAEEVLRAFPVTPTDMDMGMHMFEVMYAPSDELTLMAMLPVNQISMDHVTRTGVEFTTESQGLGDVALEALYTFYGDVRRDQHRLLLNAGVSLPTGSIDERDDTPAGADQPLPYPMQLGSGTVDLLPGLTYLGESEDWAWMAQVKGAIRLGRNDNDYRLGNQARFGAWGARKLSDWSSLSALIEGRTWGNIDGADPRLNPRIVPTADPDRRGGERLDFVVGLNIYVPEGAAEGNRAAIEVGFPLYRSLDGPQLETDWHVTAVWNWTF